MPAEIKEGEGKMTIDIDQEGERLKKRAENLFDRAIAGEIEAVIEELGNIDIQFDHGYGIVAGDHYDAGLLRAIAKKVFPDGWEWMVVEIFGEKPQIKVISYNAP
jgi:hypothetical protein